MGAIHETAYLVALKVAKKARARQIRPPPESDSFQTLV
jgi:hypothetical protein